MFRTLLSSTVRSIQLKPVTSTFSTTIPSITSIPTVSYFSTSSINYKTNTSTRTKENVHDLTTFLTLIGRNSIEYKDLFEDDLNKFLSTTSAQMKNMGIDTRARRYLLRWRHKFLNDLEPLREHKLGKKRNGGERKAKTVIAKRQALERLEEKEKWAQEELEAEKRGERLF
ncbi:protein FYV4, mitochondrial [Candida albicans P57072]|nr:protein FYV4, mitochondrial [Candida albicans GC75]KGR15307.1 protein FYV4, mitochondrial [Candida albicans P57072]KGR23233.1 protein FYV4, mitochondrial [Candida albicans P37037]KGU18423.1 protein FYV4, mitochondrial [Candida albicans L26]KHC43009.1 protein FYV4, mitochondrial [Candida albicans P76067]KHC50062.1 protein FYV4, mitochondrial [Candida albicans Ca6]